MEVKHSKFYLALQSLCAGSTNFDCEGPDSNYCRLCKSHASLSHTLLLVCNSSYSQLAGWTKTGDALSFGFWVVANTFLMSFSYFMYLGGRKSLTHPCMPHLWQGTYEEMLTQCLWNSWIYKIITWHIYKNLLLIQKIELYGTMKNITYKHRALVTGSTTLCVQTLAKPSSKGERLVAVRRFDHHWRGGSWD